MVPEDYADRLIHLFAGECSAREKEELEAWMAADPANRKEADRLRALWEAAGGSTGETPDVDRMWARLREHAGIPSAPDHLRTMRPPVPQRRSRYVAVTAGVLAGLTAIVVLLMVFTPWSAWQQPQKPVMREMATGPGQRAQIILSDGTHVTLNARSRLIIPGAFTEHERLVHLEGEAFFEVTPDKNRPFRVRVKGANAEVLGTRFNVGAYPDEPGVTIVVDEGKVAVRPEKAPARQAVLLVHDQMASITLKDERIVKQNVDADDYLEWMDGRLVFVEATIDQVARQLGRWYGLEIQLELSPRDVDRLNASFEKDESIEEVLNIIVETLNLRYERHNQRVIIYPAGRLHRSLETHGA